MKYTIKAFASLLLLGSMSCTANYLEINSNPYQPGDLIADDYALGSAMNSLAGCVISPDENTTQFTDCLLGGTQGGYFADANGKWDKTISNYNPTDDWSRVFLKTDKIIPILYSNLAVVKRISEQNNDPVPYAIAEVIKVASMHRVADTFGPIPYSKIGEDGKIATPYDSLEEVYNKFFEELNESIKVLTDHQNAALLPSSDYIYGGKVKNWVKLANSLKLRLALRIAYANPAKAQQMAEEAVNHEIGVITSNAENALWKYFGTIVNPINIAVNYNTAKHEDGSVCPTGGDSHAAADIIAYMNSYNDPRRAAYFSNSEWDNTDFCGLRRGIAIPDLSSMGHKYSGIKVGAHDPLMWMNAAEVAFLRAEGIAVFNFNLGGSAQDFYNEGIRLSFEQWGAGESAEYAASTEETPVTYTDPAGNENYMTPLSKLPVQWNEGATIEEKQERIIIQKWIANYPLGCEAWADYRRTGYPHLIPASLNKSLGEVDSERGARRMRYPRDEYVSNTDNVNHAVSNYLNGPDLMSTDLWWACKK